MTTISGPTSLLRSGDTAMRRGDPDEDVRGRRVVDRNEDEIGVISELLLDEEEHRVRFLEVQSEGFLHLAATAFLIPIDAVGGVSADAVHIDQSREQVAGAPRYDPDQEDERFWNHVYDYWGYLPY